MRTAAPPTATTAAAPQPSLHSRARPVRQRTGPRGASTDEREPVAAATTRGPVFSFGSLAVQRKLAVGRADDPLEAEADRIAESVLSTSVPPAAVASTHAGAGAATPAAPVQRACACEDDGTETVQRTPSMREAYIPPESPVEEEEPEETIRPKSRSAPGVSVPAPSTDAGGPPSRTALESEIGSLRGGGERLPPSARAFLEPRFGVDFGHVRVHASPRAASVADRLNATAFTVGSDIAFASGAYDPYSAPGRKLLAHELAHVVQQGSGLASAAVQPVQRFVSPGVERMRDLLSYGLFDWVITDAEALEALLILQRLPRIEQAEFVSDTKYLERLRSNLPEERRDELAGIEQGVAGAVPPRDTVDDIIDKLSYGVFDWVITDAEAVAALERLKELSGDQLAVTLARIDYGRLMDNLPDDRRQELVDLLAAGVGTAGARETSRKASPGAVIKSLRFSSDHGVMKDNTEDWNNSGTLYGEPEWSMDATGKVTSHPISHTKDTNVDAELGFDVVPTTADPAPVRITGNSAVGALRFDYSGTASGGTGKTAAMTSSVKLPNRVQAIEGAYVDWSMRWGTWERPLGRTGPHAIFTTMAAPRRPTEVTHKRMALAVGLVGRTGTLVPHDIVRTIAFTWTHYNLDVQYTNAWELADDLETGAQCIDLVRFVQGILDTVGSPGTAQAVVVWAQPTAPTVGIENLWPHGGMSSGLIPAHPLHPSWRAVLVDGNMRPNNFEAALKFDHGGTTKYYPGGVRSVLDSPDEVLRVFQCLAWIKSVPGNKFEIMAVPASYRGGCVVGARHPWGS